MMNFDLTALAAVGITSTKEQVAPAMTAPVGEIAPVAERPSLQTESAEMAFGQMMSQPISENTEIAAAFAAACKSVADSAVVETKPHEAVERPAAIPTAGNRLLSVAVERPVVVSVERPVATAETLARVVVENKAVERALPEPLAIPAAVERPEVTTTDNRLLTKAVERPVVVSVERPVVVAVERPVAVAVERPVAESVERPVATAETLARVVVENKAVEKALPEPLAIPAAVERPEVTTADNLLLSKAVERPVAVAVERPVVVAVERPVATVETLARVVVENKAVERALPKPLAIPAAVERPEPVPTDNRLLSKAVERPEAATAKRPLATVVTLARVVSENKAIEKTLPEPLEIPREIVRKTLPEANEVDVPQALPETAHAAVAPAATVERTVNAERVGGVASVASVSTPVKASDILLEAVTAVADTMMVSPGLMRGDGEIRLQLKPDVLDGAGLVIRVDGRKMEVEFTPVTERVTEQLANIHPQLVQQLADRIQAYDVSVTVLRGVVGRTAGRKNTTEGDGVA